MIDIWVGKKENQYNIGLQFPTRLEISISRPRNDPVLAHPEESESRRLRAWALCKQHIPDRIHAHKNTLLERTQ